MSDKNKGPEGTDPNASQQPSQEQEQEQQPATQQVPAQDHSTLVDALKKAFAKEPVSTEVKVGMDETIEGGKYIRFGQLVNANGEPIDETGRKLKKD